MSRHPHRLPRHRRGACRSSPASANAADKVTFLTSWYAQAEHGGFYQAKAAGLYEKAGLDVTIKMGGPQVNGLQLLLAGEADVMMGYDFQVLQLDRRRACRSSPSRRRSRRTCRASWPTTR